MLSAGRGVDPEELYRVTAGNPFYVREVLEAGLGEVPGSPVMWFWRAPPASDRKHGRPSRPRP